MIVTLDPARVVIETDPHHALYRKGAEAALSPGRDAALVASVAFRGVEAPISVVEAGDRFVVVDGLRRLKAARLVAAWRWERGAPALTIRCIVVGLMRVANVA